MIDRCSLVGATQIAQYRDQGYVRLAGVFPPSQVAALQRAADALCVSASAKGGAWRGSTWKQPHEGHEHFELITVDAVHETSPEFREAVANPVFVEAVSALAGHPMACVASMLIVKPPFHGQAFPPHQDAAYYDQDEPDYLIAGVYLDHAGHDEGPVAYQPGSHTSGFHPHQRDGKKWLPHVALSDLVEVPAEAGDVVCSSIFTVHGSSPNRSATARRLVRVGFRPVR